MIERGFDATYIFVFSSFVLLGIVDSVLTYIGVMSGLVEANIFLHPIIQSGWIFFFIFKLLVYGILAKICIDLKSRLIPISMTFIGLAVVTWNISLLI